MIQDIAPHHLFNEYRKDAKVSAEDFVLCFTKERKVLVNVENEIAFPKAGALGITDATYLFSLDEMPFFLAKEAVEAIDGFEYLPIQEIRSRRVGPREMRYVLYTAKHLNEWYQSAKFCGCCGTPMLHDRRERAMRCPKCNHVSYPFVMPAVIVGVTNGDQLLITRYREGFRENALVAGFTEIGETLEETVVREVMEEAGLHVKNVRYYKSQPWGPAGDILAGFYCDVEGDPTIHMDEGELKYAEWVRREDIVLQSNDDSLTNEMMKRFKEGA